jgi:3'-5' exonuclease
MDITIDIETIPAQDPAILESIRENLRTDFKAPSALTKEKACAELGMTDPEKIKDTSKDSALAMWVERFRDEKLEETAQEQWRKTSFDGGSGQIAVIGVALDDEEPITFYSEDWANDEVKVLRAAFDVIKDAYTPSSDRRPVFIGHYVTEFDLRFIFQRAVVLGVKPPSIIPFHARPWDDYVFDTMTRWAGLKGSVGLDRLCGALGIPGKTDGVDGSKVWDMVSAGRIAEVASYCANDVRMARAAYKRLTFAEAA